MKKNIYPIIYSLVGAIIFSIIGLLFFMRYGASDCDVPGKFCNCFCCNSFGLRGYESCGNYGFWFGTIIGIILGLIVYLFVRKIFKKKNNR